MMKSAEDLEKQQQVVSVITLHATCRYILFSDHTSLRLDLFFALTLK